MLVPGSKGGSNNNVQSHSLSRRISVTQYEDHHDQEPDDEKIEINVGGQINRTLASTLLSKPGTRLYDLCVQHVSTSSDERLTRYSSYFYDRNPDVFSSILEYYRSGELHIPNSICSTVTRRELEYWRVSETFVEPCCFVNYYSQISNQQTLNNLSGMEDDEKQETEELSLMSKALRNEAGPIFKKIMSMLGPRVGRCVGRILWARLHVWRFLRRPKSSTAALVYSVITLLIMLLSISCYCIESIPYLMPFVRYPVNSNCTPRANPRDLPAIYALRMCETFCTFYFQCEYIILFLVSPHPLWLFLNPFTIVDILALVPYYVYKEFEKYDMCANLQNWEPLQVLRVLRMFRIYRVLFQYKAMQVLVRAVMDSLYELVILATALLACMLVYASLIYYTESSVPDTQFINIPIGLYWSLITMATVGYGDFCPKTISGFFVGGLCAVTGIALVSLLIPALSSNFTLYYEHTRAQEAARNHGRKSADFARFNVETKEKDFDRSRTIQLIEQLRQARGSTTYNTAQMEEDEADADNGGDVEWQSDRDTIPTAPSIAIRGSILDSDSQEDVSVGRPTTTAPALMLPDSNYIPAPPSSVASFIPLVGSPSDIRAVPPTGSPSVIGAVPLAGSPSTAGYQLAQSHSMAIVLDSLPESGRDTRTGHGGELFQSTSRYTAFGAQQPSPAASANMNFPESRYRRAGGIPLAGALPQGGLLLHGSPSWLVGNQSGMFVAFDAQADSVKMNSGQGVNTSPLATGYAIHATVSHELHNVVAHGTAEHGAEEHGAAVGVTSVVQGRRLSLLEPIQETRSLTLISDSHEEPKDEH